jgi:hypothetical protein
LFLYHSVVLTQQYHIVKSIQVYTTMWNDTDLYHMMKSILDYTTL